MANFKHTITLSDGKKLYYNVLNSREIEIFAPNLKKTVDKDQITSLCIPDIYELNIEDEFEIISNGKKQSYTIKYIEETETPKKYILISHKPNRTTTYLLPVLEFLSLSDEITSKENKATLYDFERYGFYSYLINAYLHKEEKTLKLIYRFNTHESYINLENELKHHKLFIGMKEEGYKYVAVYYNIPKEHYKDIDAFITGKYSKISKKLKYSILKFLSCMPPVVSKMQQVLNKDEGLKEAIEEVLGITLPKNSELDSKPTEEDFYE